MGKFRSAVLELPPEIRKEIETLIDNDSSGLAIYSSLKTKYTTGPATIPSLPTILRYMKYYKVEKLNVQKELVEEKLLHQYESGVQEIERLVIQVSKNEDPKFNKIKLLEGLVGKCMLRVNELENSAVGSKANTAVEGAIVRYIAEVKSIVDSITKLSCTAQEDEKVLIQIIRNESVALLHIIKEVVLAVCPDKYGEFKLLLNQRLQNKNLEVDKTIDATTTTPAELPTIPQPEQIPESVTCTISEPILEPKPN